MAKKLVYDPKTAIQTNHIQFGPKVYIKYIDIIVDLTTHPSLNYDEIVGSAQGEGIETLWWDGSNESFMLSDDPVALQKLAHEANAAIKVFEDAIPDPFEVPAPGAEPQTKPKRRLVLKKKEQPKKTVDATDDENADWMHTLPGYEEPGDE